MDYMVESFRRLEDTVARGFEDVRTQLSQLPGDYVPRREFDRYRDERTIEMAAALKRHEDDIGEIKSTLRDSRTARMQWIAVGATALLAVPASIYALVQIFSHLH